MINKDDNSEEEIQLDDQWITDFEKTDKLYEDYYLEDVYYTDIHCVYVDRQNNIETITEESFLMSNKNVISKEEINQILKRSTMKDKKKYTLLSLLKCNISLKPEDINVFISSSNMGDYFDQFVKTANSNASILFEKTINMFQDLNDLFIILYECPPNSFSKTRRNHPNGSKKTLKNNKIFFNINKENE